MLKFLAKIQFSIEMLLWLSVIWALAHFLSHVAHMTANAGYALPVLTGFIWNHLNWFPMWLVPILFILLAALESRHPFAKWLQWTLRIMAAAKILVMLLASDLPFQGCCAVIK